MVGGDECDDGGDSDSTGQVEVCDGGDNDCEGDSDEGFEGDSDGFVRCQDDYDDNDPLVNPDADELCNGQDDNCDGEIDLADPLCEDSLPPPTSACNCNAAQTPTAGSLSFMLCLLGAPIIGVRRRKRGLHVHAARD